MKKKLIIIITVIAVAGGIIFLVTGDKEEKINYKEVNPRRGDISLTVQTNGTVKPRNRLEVEPPISGRIDEILVREGSRVKKGEIVAWMSSTERAALLDTARSKGEEELKRWEDVYKPTPVIAPITGFIIKRNKEPGQTVTSQDPILVLADDLIIKARVDETDMGKLQKGQSAVITMDAYPGKKIPGTIEHIAYESEVVNNITIYQVDIKPMEELDMLRSGMSADIDIQVQEKKDAMLLPIYAVNMEEGKTTVRVKSKEEDSPKVKKIETGIDNGEMIQVKSGLGENDTVLISGDYRGDDRFRGRGGLPGMN
ncbi:MAG: efflux RND transporter periplasmic adaptor subunit [Elusimicrobiota bacterium]